MLVVCATENGCVRVYHDNGAIGEVPENCLAKVLATVLGIGRVSVLPFYVLLVQTMTRIFG